MEEYFIVLKNKKADKHRKMNLEKLNRVSESICAYFLCCVALLVFSTASYSQTYKLSTTLESYQNLQSPDYVIPETSPYFGNIALTVNFNFPGFGSKYNFNNGANIAMLQGHMFDTNNTRSATIYIFEAELKAREGINQTSFWSYELKGSPGNQLLKLEWKNMGFKSGDSSDYINFQLWLYEATGKIEIRFGPNSVSSSVYGNNPGPAIGLLEMNPGFSIIYEEIYLINWPENPGIDFNGYSYLSGTPEDGTVYTFTNVLLGYDPEISISNPAIRIFPTITNDRITLVFPSEAMTESDFIYIYNMSGKLIYKEQISALAHEISLGRDVESGMYILMINYHGVFTRKRFVKIDG